jgi:alpha-D-ribose 1-methylphosphonate 5-triphosphate synthase subunit PhnH
MSALATVKPYDAIFDSQKHYRTLLDCTARPGSIGQLDDVQLTVPASLHRSTALIALALFTGDISFYLAGADEQTSEFVQRQTAARPAAGEEADFLILCESSLLASVPKVRVGALAYPDLAATVIVQVEAISPAPISRALRLTCKGPGIETETVVFVSGISAAFLAMRAELNSEYPMGIDVFLTCDSLSAGPCVVSLPRTTRVEWEMHE